MSAPRTPGTGDGLANLAIGALIGLAGLAGVLRLAGTIAAFLTGAPQPRAGVATGFMVLVQPGDPGAALDAEGLSAVAYWITAVMLLVGLGVLAWWVWGQVRDHARRVEVDPRRLAGTATRSEVARAASGRALLGRASTLRPSLDKPQTGDVGYLLGRSRGASEGASGEDSILLV
ncbi:MAG TPA: type VI secretion protein, partial [Microbacterium sp.]|nr:type VI secretion protein [Microbacterium sp.]